MSVPPRLFAILARDAPVGVVFVRGPTRRCTMLRWNLEQDEFEQGQTLHGRVYPRRCDLSRDGTHMIAMLGKHGRRDPGGYTVVCRPPHFTALAFHAAGHCWNGGGLFHDDGSYWIDEGYGFDGPHRRVPDAPRRRDAPPGGTAEGKGEDPVLYPQRLMRDGWSYEGVRPHGALCLVFHRHVAGTTLRKTLYASSRGNGPNGTGVWETHELEDEAGLVALGDEWAEADGDTVVYAREGRLYRIAPDEARGPRPGPILDARVLVPAQVEAPYDGVPREARA